MEKHEWRKKEKNFYLPKNRPELIEVPEFKFITIAGEGNPNNDFFAEYISVLYSMAYTIKMTYKKKEKKPNDYNDYTVYPLEGIWDFKEEAKEDFDGAFNKDNLVFKLMIRQPNFLNEAYFQVMLEFVSKEKPNVLLEKVKFEKITDGMCIQMLHLGSYDDEPESIRQMEEFANEKGLKRFSKKHREIYLSDFRKVPTEKLKTVLRFQVK